MLYTNYFYASYGGKIKMNKLLSKKPVPLYIEAYLCSPSEELANVIIDIVDIVPFSNISYPVKAARGMVDPDVTEDKVNKVIELIVEKIGDLIKKLADLIPENIKDMIDVEEMAKNDIQEVLTATFEGAVYDQNESFVDELNKAIDNCKI